MLLEQVKNISFVDEEVNAEFAKLNESITALIKEAGEDFGIAPNRSGRKMPFPGMADDAIQRSDSPEADEISAALEDAVKQMVAVKKATAILNRMPDSASRTRNKSRVMGNFNRIRGSLQRIAKMMAQ